MIEIAEGVNRAAAPRTPLPENYSFSVDWFSRNIPYWSGVLGELKPSRLLEIGSFEGRSTVYLVEFCSQFGRIDLCCVDTWEGGVEHQGIAMGTVEDRFDANVKIARSRARNAAAVHKIKLRSDLALSKMLGDGLRQSFDFVYVDGSHEACDVLADAVLAFKLLRVGGVMIFDDYLWKTGANPLNEPKIAIDAFTTLYGQKVQVLSDAPLYQLYVMKTAD